MTYYLRSKVHDTLGVLAPKRFVASFELLSSPFPSISIPYKVNQIQTPPPQDIEYLLKTTNEILCLSLSGI